MNIEIVFEVLALATFGAVAGAAVGVVVSGLAGFKIIGASVCGGLCLFLLLLWGLELPAY